MSDAQSTDFVRLTEAEREHLAAALVSEIFAKQTGHETGYLEETVERILTDRARRDV